MPMPKELLSAIDPHLLKQALVLHYHDRYLNVTAICAALGDP